MELNICHLYPDILNLYGDRGNILCMRKRLAWRGIDVNVDEVSIGQKLEASKYDLLFIGGGQDFEQEVLLPDLRGEKTEELKAAIEDKLPVLAICGGYQMLGQYYKTWDGVQCDFTGALDLYTVGCEAAHDRQLYVHLRRAGLSTVVGFENHSGKTYLGDGVKPIGKVLAGLRQQRRRRLRGRALQERLRDPFGTAAPASQKSADCGLCAENGAGAKIRRTGIKAA